MLIDTSRPGQRVSIIPSDCLTVSLSLSASASSIATSCSSPSFFTLFGFRVPAILSVSQYFFHNLYNATLLTNISSSASLFYTSAADKHLSLRVKNRLLVSILNRGISDEPGQISSRTTCVNKSTMIHAHAQVRVMIPVPERLTC